MIAQPQLSSDALPFRIGTTSYIIQADLVANATYLADKVQDMQLVLFDLPGGPSNLPSPNEIAALKDIAHNSGLTYTVHLIDDLRLADDGSLDHPSLYKAHEVITLTQPLTPWAYVLHLDGRAVQSPATSLSALAGWQEDAKRALAHVATLVNDAALLAVENLEGYPPAFVTPVVERLPVSRCVDVGHLWRDGEDPLPWLTPALSHTKVVHLHGVQRSGPQTGHDHQSLGAMAAAELDPIVHYLITTGYRGVLTLEIFGEVDFAESLAALVASLRRYDPAGA